MTADPEHGTATPASQEAAADHKELRLLFSPTETLRVLDEFAKWIFATTAIVGALGTGLGLTGLDKLDGIGKGFFLAAVGCLSLALILAALARSPMGVTANRDQPDALRGAYERIVKRRYRLLVAAALLFVAALALAGLAAVLSD